MSQLEATMIHVDSHPSADDRFYGQHGEDVIAWKVFRHSSGPHYFVEVGMIDGLRFSNTLAFERRGWRGLCVEAHPDYVDKVRVNRPGSTVIHAAAADVGGSHMPFYADPRGDLSTLVAHDEAEMKRRFGRWFQGYQVINVPVRTLDDMLEQAKAPIGFELLSIDIEGAELAALRGMDLKRWRPRMLILEADNPRDLQELNDHLRPLGYRLARMIGINAVYTRTRRDAWRTRLARLDRKVLHTAHPVDQSVPEQVVIPCTFETRSQYLRRLVGLVRPAA